MIAEVHIPHIYVEEYVSKLSSKRILLYGGSKLQHPDIFFMIRLHNIYSCIKMCTYKNRVIWSSFDHVSNGCNCCIIENSLNFQLFGT